MYDLDYLISLRDRYAAFVMFLEEKKNLAYDRIDYYNATKILYDLNALIDGYYISVGC